MERAILHIDMNNFYASVECLYRPEIRDYPVVVGGNEESRHGIVLAKNYHAKAFGIKTAETLVEARKKCPNLVVVPPHFDRYLLYSKMAKEIYSDYTDQIESFGLDENWLDVTGSQSLFGSADIIADKIRERIKFELGVTVSIGVSFNKIFSKLGSDMKKPDAVTIITKENFKKKVWPLPAADLLYVGRQTEKKLTLSNIKTIGDLANSEPKFLSKFLGVNGYMLWNFANGNDTSPVKNVESGFGHNGDSGIKSIGNSTTAPRDLTEADSIKTTLYILSESVAARLRENRLKATVIQITICENTFLVYERQCKIPYPTSDSNEIFRNAFDLVMRNKSQTPIRKLGVRACNLVDDSFTQLSILPDVQKMQRHEVLENTIDEIRGRFGHHSVQRAIMLSDEKLSKVNPKDDHVIYPVSFISK